MARRASALDTYRAKRDFAKTPEPPPRLARKKGWSFVVQKHAATRLHYDFRLELDGVLKSWAVTRGPSLNPADKRLAVEVEDHPLEYGGFEGTIPRKEYGGGTVMLWDRGTWQPVGDPHEGLAAGNLKFNLTGERLKGKFVLVRMKRRPGEKRENWLLIKERDDEIDTEGNILEEFDRSVSTGRSMDEIASGKSRVWTKAGEQPARNTPPPRPPAKPVRKSAVNLPAFVSPQLATLVERPPEGRQWRHELKYDGYRMIAAVAGGAVRLYSRNKKDWTSRFPAIAQELAGLDVSSALLDGEMVVLDAKGRSSFSALQATLSEGRDDATYIVFDILELDGRNLRGEPLSARTKLLEGILRDPAAPVRPGGYLIGSGAKIFAAACKMGAEGIVSKRIDQPYRSARTQSWVKAKCVNTDEFVIIGYRPSDKGGRAFASLLVAEYEGDKLVYRGRVGTGYDEKTLARLGKRLGKLAIARAAVADVPADISRHARWVRPELVAQVGYAERTTDGILRQPRFEGLREDKPAKDVQEQMPKIVKTEKAARASAPAKASPRAGRDAQAMTGGVRITHPDKIVYPDIGLTKRALADYYVLAAPFMLPHAQGRPVSLVRCPDGAEKKCFFQKHHLPGFEAFGSVRVKEHSDNTDYLTIADATSFVAGAQMGAFEFHIWGSRVDDIERPDRLVFDLDPDEALPFSQVVTAATDMRGILSAAGLKSFALLTGGKGIHVVVPIKRQHTFEELKPFCAGVARRMAQADPQRFVAKMTKSIRKGRIFIDYLRNDRGSTAIAPYSTRARAGAPVAVPVSWTELPKLKGGNAFGIDAAIKRLKSAKADPWQDYFATRQAVSVKVLKFFAGD